MAELLKIEEPARAQAPQWRAFLELGFRPLQRDSSRLASCGLVIAAALPR